MSQSRFQVVVIVLLVVLVGVVGVGVYRMDGQPVATAMGVTPIMVTPQPVKPALPTKPAAKKSGGIPLSSLPESREAPRVIIVEVPGSTELLQAVEVQEGIFPHSSNQMLTEAELFHCGDHKLRLARNEIYARHGCVFSKQDLQTYFNTQPWYQPIPGRSAVNFKGLSLIERQNVDLIKAIEKKRKT